MPIRDAAGITGTTTLPTLSIGPATLTTAEGSGGGTTIFAYTVTRAGDASRAITATWTVTGSGANPASASDFTSGVLPTGTITLAAGQSVAVINVPIAADTIVEPDEGFTVTLSGASMAVAVSVPAASGVILNDDLAVAGYDVIVLAGQSNMIGRNGPVDATLDAGDARIVQYGFDAQAVVAAADPLDHQDETANTVGMGLAFAKAYLATIASNRKVLLVPCARGGTAFGTGFWRAGGGGDTPAIARVNAAMAQGAGTNKLAAILWHQGESDQSVTQGQYEADLDALIARWRSSMTGAVATTPFVAGALLIGGAQTGAGVTAALAATTGRTGYTGFAASTGLSSGGDNLHFDAASQRTLGGRYFDAFNAAKTNGAAPATAPAAPTLGVTAGAAQTMVALTDGATGGSAITARKLYRSTVSGFTPAAGNLIATSPTFPFADTGLINGTAYYYRAISTNAVGDSAASAQATATPVAPAAGTNLLTQPQAFDAWTANGSAVAADVAANPVSGATTADRVTQAAGSSTHNVTTSGGQGAVASGSTYTFAFDVKPETQQYAQLFVSGSVASTQPYVNFDLGAGASTASGGGASATVTALANGWKRVAMTFAASGSVSFAGVLSLIVSPTNSRGAAEAVASGAEKTLLVSNAQLVAGTTANAF